ncbi:uncharacterized protein [Medicago truncatula]|nr:uncharacterized protein LOC25494409 [Medicago truncatula]
MVMILICFPFLEELDHSNPKNNGNFAANSMLLELPKLRRVNLSDHHYANGSLLLHLYKNCVFLQEIVMLNTYYLTDNEITSAICERPGLRSISITRMTFGNLNIFIESLVNLTGLTSLDLSYSFIPDELLSYVAEKALPIRKLFLQGYFGYTYFGIFNLLSKCQFIQYLDLQNAKFMNDWNVIELSLFLGDLLSINISKCDSPHKFILVFSP